MFRKSLILLSLLLFGLSANGQKVRDVIAALRELPGGEKMSAENIRLDITKHEPRINVYIKEMEVAEFRRRELPEAAAKFERLLENLDDPGFHRAESTEENHLVVYRSRAGVIREIILFRHGSRFGMIRFEGKIPEEEFWPTYGELFHLVPETGNRND